MVASMWGWILRMMMTMSFFVACYATLHPALSVGRSVGWSHFTFFMIFMFGPHCSCPNGLVTSNMAPAHPHATSVAVYPALFLPSLLSCYLSFFLSFFLFFSSYLSFFLSFFHTSLKSFPC